MSETWLAVGGTQGTIRVVLKNISPRRGLGVARLMFTFEVTAKQQAVVGSLLWLGGRVEVLHLPRHTMSYLASFHPQTQPMTLPQLGVDQTLQLTFEVSDRQLQFIEDRRATGGIQLNIWLSGYAVQDGQYIRVSESQFSHDISQSEWIDLLQQVGYRQLLLLELEAPDPQAHPDLADAINHYSNAQQRFLEGEWRLTVESLRQSLAALVGKKAEDEEEETNVQDALKAVRNESFTTSVGYEPRLELTRRAAKFMCDLGSHPEVAETRRHHAYGALVVVGGLLHTFTASE